MEVTKLPGHPRGLPAALWRHRNADHSFVGTIGTAGGLKTCAISSPQGRQGTNKVVVVNSTKSCEKFVPSHRLNKLLELGCFYQPPTDEPAGLAGVPDRLLRKIFLHLPDAKSLARCEFVCKTWRNVIQRSALNVAKIRVERVTFQHVADNFKSGCSFERRVEKDKESGERKSRRWRLRRNCDFVAIRWNFTGDSSDLFLLMQRVLVKVSPYGIGFIDCDVTKFTLGLVPRLVAHVRQLRFLHCDLETNALAGLNFVSSLRELAIDQCMGVDDSISSESLLPLISKNDLKTLELCGSDVLHKVDDRVLEALTTMWKYSRFDCLKLANCPNLSSTAISKVINHFMRQDGKKAVIFLNKTCFDTEKFLDQSKTFKLDASILTSRRILLKSGETTVWVELNGGGKGPGL